MEKGFRVRPFSCSARVLLSFGVGYLTSATNIREDEFLEPQADTVEALIAETRSILIVEDDKELLHGFKSILNSEGSIIEVAETAGAALELLLQHDFDLFLIDISLPDANGIDLLKRIHLANHYSVKIMLTGNADTFDVIESLNNGADHFLLKPVQPEMLLKVIDEKLRERRVRPHVIACIPAFNEEKKIGSIIEKTREHVDYILVCDDGSSDLTAKVAGKFGAVVMAHPTNRGKGAALKTAFNHAKTMGCDIVVMLDADGQHDPSEIPALIKPISTGQADMVLGSRYLEGAEMNAPSYRRFGLSIFNSLSNKTGNHNVTDTQSGFRAFSTRALDIMLRSETEGYGVETEQLALAQQEGLRIVEVPVAIKYGDKKTSKLNPLSHAAELFETMLRLVVEDRPSMIGIPGLGLMIIGVISGLYFLWGFNVNRYFSLPIALITIGTSLMGTLLVITSLLLYAINKMRIQSRANIESR